MRVNLHLRFVAAILFASAALGALNLLAQTKPEWRTGYYHGREVTYQVVDGLAIYAGDIILGRAAELEAPGFQALSALVIPTRYWPNAVVPYEMDPALPNPQRVAGAVAYFSQNSPVQWLPFTTDRNFV